jgi:hypothetical protein
MYWLVLLQPAYSSDLALSDFHLFVPYKQTLGGKIYGYDDEVTLIVQRWLDEQPQVFLKGA